MKRRNFLGIFAALPLFGLTKAAKSDTITQGEGVSFKEFVEAIPRGKLKMMKLHHLKIDSERTWVIKCSDETYKRVQFDKKTKAVTFHSPAFDSITTHYPHIKDCSYKSIDIDKGVTHDSKCYSSYSVAFDKNREHILSIYIF